MGNSRIWYLPGGVGLHLQVSCSEQAKYDDDLQTVVYGGLQIQMGITFVASDHP